MATSPPRSPTAFISYSWDSPEHRNWVCALAARLRGDGVDVILDQWAMTPGDQLPAFMERAIRENDYVVIVCTPKYKRRSDARKGGVGYEGDIIAAEVLVKGDHRKFIPILRGPKWESSAPSMFLGKWFVDLRGDPSPEDKYRQLLATLHGMLPEAPPLGDPPNPVMLDGNQRESILQFAAITASRADPSGETLGGPPHGFPFDAGLKCAAHLQFGTVDPVIDVTVINRSTGAIVVSAVGIEVLSVAQIWWVGAVLKPRVIPVSTAVEVAMPDVWKVLKARGLYKEAITLADVQNIAPQQIELRVLTSLKDPLLLERKCPFRYTLQLQHYRDRMPDYAIVRFWVQTSEGLLSSGLVSITTANHVLHAVAKGGHEFYEFKNRADKCWAARDFAGAESALRKALSLKNSVDSEEFDEARLLHNLGMTCYQQKKLNAALEFLQQSIPLFEQRYAPNEEELLRCLDDLARVHEGLGDHQAAEEVHSRLDGIKGTSPFVVTDGGDVTVRPSFMGKLTSLEKTGKHGQAATMWQMLLRRSVEHYGEEHAISAHMHNQLGAAFYRDGQYANAEGEFRAASRIREKLLGTRHEDVANSLNNLASSLREQAKFAEAEQHYRKAIGILDGLGGSSLSCLPFVLECYAKLLDRMGRSNEAAEKRQRAREIETGA